MDKARDNSNVTLQRLPRNGPRNALSGCMGVGSGAVYDKITAMQTLRLTTTEKCVLVNITADVKRLVQESGVRRGLCLIHAPHTTAGIAVQEGYDPDVARDITRALNEQVPDAGDYQHAEGNSPAHIKSLITGTGQVLPIEYGTLQLGRWQAVFFCEFDGPRERTAWVQIINAEE